MCDFDNLSDNAKKYAHDQLMVCVDAFGGINHFLQLLEAVRKTKPHPLLAKSCGFRFLLGTIKWEKVIFADKLNLLMEARRVESKNNNLFPEKQDKQYKKILNLVRTLSPIEFVVKPKEESGSEGFTVKAFDLINETTTRINPIFDALFFCSIDTVKKVINYTAKA